MTQLLPRAYYRIRAGIHIRHWRGRRIHSPFVYGVVREVFMKKGVVGDRELYGILHSAGIRGKNAALLQNLYNYCGMERYAVIDGNTAPVLPVPFVERTLCIVLSSTGPETACETARNMEGSGGILAVVSPHREKKRRRATENIRKKVRCVSIDRQVLKLYFFNPKLQPRHYRI